MVKVDINSDGNTFQFNGAGALVMAIKPIKEDGEKTDLGLGIYGVFSVYDAMETIVYCTKELFKTWTNQYGTDQRKIRTAFQRMVREELSPEEITMTATVDINEDVLKVIMGMKNDEDNPAKDIEIRPLPTEKGWG